MIIFVWRQAESLFKKVRSHKEAGNNYLLEGVIVLLPNYAEGFLGGFTKYLFQPVPSSAAVISEAQALMN
jgi:hypothetical protein